MNSKVRSMPATAEQTESTSSSDHAQQAPLMLSVSGLRGLIGQSLTPPVAARFAAAFGTWLRHDSARSQSRAVEETRTGTGNGIYRVVVGRDSRPSGEAMEAAVVAGLISVGCEPIRVGILTTPGVGVMIDEFQADGGVVITASHNPLPWNGIKVLRHDAVAPPPEQTQQIIKRFHDDDFDYATADAMPAAKQDNSGVQVHLDRVLKIVDVELIRSANLTAVVDSVHGAGGQEAAVLLDALNVKRVHLYAEPTGLFPHTPEPTRENLTELCEVMKREQADVGFAQDPDADRLAVVDEHGTYIGEEYTLALAARHGLKQGETIVANLSTSRMIDDIAAEVGASVVRTPVGEANVCRGMRQHEALLGGEGNGGIIRRDITQIRDSITGMALILEMLAQRKQSLSEVVNSFPSYAILKRKVDVNAELVDALIPKLSAAFSDQTIDTQDGIRIDWPDRWIHVRPSNTEPIIRLIAEAAESADAEALIQQACEALGISC